MSFVWGSLFLLFLFIEIVTVDLLTIWFALGALITMIVSMFVENMLIQIVVFIISSIICLFLTKPFIQKFKLERIEPTNLDRVIGKIGYVTKKITPKSNGEVKVLGSFWTAVSYKDIEEGSDVLIKQIDGVKLIVEEVKK